MDTSENMTIGCLAKATGVTVETIRFYQLKRLLPTPQRHYGRIRRYGAADADRIGFIKSAQRLGFSLGEVGELLQLEDGTRCTEAAELAARQLADVRAKVADISRIESVLSALLNECRDQRGNVSCPLIAALHRR